MPVYDVSSKDLDKAHFVQKVSTTHETHPPVHIQQKKVASHDSKHTYQFFYMIKVHDAGRSLALNASAE
jgi:hypothetical protein